MEGTRGNADYLNVKLIRFSMHLNIPVPGHYPYQCHFDTKALPEKMIPNIPQAIPVAIKNTSRHT